MSDKLKGFTPNKCDHCKGTGKVLKRTRRDRRMRPATYREIDCQVCQGIGTIVQAPNLLAKIKKLEDRIEELIINRDFIWAERKKVKKELSINESENQELKKEVEHCHNIIGTQSNELIKKNEAIEKVLKEYEKTEVGITTGVYRLFKQALKESE